MRDRGFQHKGAYMVNRHVALGQSMKNLLRHVPPLSGVLHNHSHSRIPQYALLFRVPSRLRLLTSPPNSPHIPPKAPRPVPFHRRLVSAMPLALTVPERVQKHVLGHRVEVVVSPLGGRPPAVGREKRRLVAPLLERWPQPSKVVGRKLSKGHGKVGYSASICGVRGVEVGPDGFVPCELVQNRIPTYGFGISNSGSAVWG